MHIDVLIHIPNWLDRPILFIMLLYRRIRFGYAFRKIPLTKGKFAIVDPKDYKHLSKYKWFAQRGKETFYAVRVGRKSEARNGKNIWMHRVILGLDEGVFCDHINHNGLDNRKVNLRPATRSQNMCNRPKTKSHCWSKFKGVSFRVDQNRWVSEIQVDGKSMFLGYFGDEIGAAKTYDRAARKFHGQFAVLNFPVKNQFSRINNNS